MTAVNEEDPVLLTGPGYPMKPKAAFAVSVSSFTAVSELWTQDLLQTRQALYLTATAPTTSFMPILRSGKKSFPLVHMSSACLVLETQWIQVSSPRIKHAGFDLRVNKPQRSQVGRNDKIKILLYFLDKNI